MSHPQEGSGSRPRLLFLSQVLPYPPDGGVKIRTFHTLRLLSQSFDVTALCFYRWKKGLVEQDLEHSVSALREFAHPLEIFPIPQEHHTWRLLTDHLSSLLTGRPYTVPTYRSTQFKNRLRHWLQKREFSLVHADSLDLSGYFRHLTGLPLACVHHDAQSRLLLRRSEQEPNPLKARYLKFQARLMKGEERRWCPKVNLNVAVSDTDARYLRNESGGGVYTVVPNGVDIDRFVPSDDPPSPTEVMFVGGTSWFPNKDALEFFATKVLPTLRELVPKVSVTWVGRATEEEIERYSALPGLTLTGYVDDIRPYAARAACFVVPIRVGGGTRIKILDGWAMGKAIVSTTIGCEGLRAIDSENILVADSAEDFAESVALVLQDQGIRRRLEQEGRRTAESTYSWDIVGAHLNKEYRLLINEEAS
jgi:polysaccharide biosynthesis protein PslH